MATGGSGAAAPAPGLSSPPARWVVERTFAWIGRHRRMSKDDEFLPTTSETWVYLGLPEPAASHASTLSA